MRYRQVYTPTDYTTITPEMVKRWMAMEARLDEMIAALDVATPEDEFTKLLHDEILNNLEYVKDGTNAD